MAYDLSPEGDAAALKARRAELRTFAEEITEIVARMPMPETYLEAERGARAVWVADRVLVRMRVETLGGDVPTKEGPRPPSQATVPPPHEEWGGRKESDPTEAEGEGWTMPYLMTPVRLRLRTYADRLMEATALLDKPTCYLEGERAQRYALAADRMLGQLYEPVKVAKSAGGGQFGEDDDMGLEPERPDYDDLEAWQNLLINKLHKLADERRSQGRTEAAAADRHSSPSPGLRGEDEKRASGEADRVRGNVPVETAPHPALRATFSPPAGRREEEGPSVRVVESVFAPNRWFGKRPCGCALSAPKCDGPCPIPP